MHTSTPSCCFRHGIHDVGVASATTEVAAHPLTNLGLRQAGQVEWLRNVRRGSTRPARSNLFDHGDGRHDLPRCTETALEAVMLDERLLHWVKLPVTLQSFDRGDLLTSMHGRQGHAGQNAAAVDVDSARPAFAAIT